ncbi:Inner membrane protein yedI [Actinomyces bovis]|uniref:Inner membrane protein yedI n=1 Tax=Actinomyces bovis TaxID=1658 RepID=A0ABY1VSJ0_9ACTO|nr:DUF808 family protein [Actinomyces bovis]SPT54013.1 Inner membrane protein yedI [Actinomyces bovis]VEG53856.1 Inner membrane protein yedI [Actinomyces israelii]
MSGFFALLDDIATLAKMTLSTIDDTASIAVKTAAKVSAAAVDDVAATPQYVTGISPDRELPIIKRITLGSLRNKFLIILPLGLLLTAVAPDLLPVALIIGGPYLCFEGGEKVLGRWLHHEASAQEEQANDEDSIVRRAITTDFVLSTELILLAIASVNETQLRRLIVLAMIALLITFAVYGLVALLIKADDFGVHLAQNASTGPGRGFGRLIVRAAPGTFTVIGYIGTIAMLWVGGEILSHNLEHFGLHYPYAFIEQAERIVSNPVLAWLCKTAVSCLIGAIIGCTLALLWAGLHQILPKRKRHNQA